jgi:hypothetical protein
MSVEGKDCNGNTIKVGDTVVTRYLNMRKVVSIEAKPSYCILKLDNGRESFGCTTLNLTALGYKQ